MNQEMRHVKDVVTPHRKWMCPTCKQRISVGHDYEMIDGKEYHTLIRRSAGCSCADEKHEVDRKLVAKKRREKKVARELKQAEAAKMNMKRRKALLVNAFGGRIKARAFDHFRDSSKVIGIHLDEATMIWEDQEALRERFKNQVVDELLKAVDGILPVE